MIENIRNSAGVARSKDGMQLADLQCYATISPFKKANHEKGSVRLRGIGPAGLVMLSELRLVQGRLYRPGTREIIVGTTAQAKFSGMEVGDSITTPLGQWRVVGAFTTATQLDGDVVGDAATVKGALAQKDYNFALVRLQTPDALDSFRASLARLNRNPVSVVRESDYYERYWKAIPNTPYIVAYFFGGLLALGAIAGTLHTMTVAVGARAREIALLRAAGFERFPITASVVIEAMLLATLGAVIGTAIDWVWLNGYVYNAQGVFRVIVTPKLLMVAIGWALAVALIGALTPALDAAKGTVADCLRK
jgi:putative ABC transport system permease protein